VVDGKVVGTAQYGNPRTDVFNALPQYQNPNSGYNYTLNTRSLTNGQHTLTVRGTGNNGVTTTLGNLRITVQNATPRGYMDSPASNSTVKGDIDVSGWFLDPSGVAKVEVLVDGNVVGAAQYGLPRSDVGNAYPEYQNPNSGYKYILNTRTLTNGQHTIAVRETGNSGLVTNLQMVKVNVQNSATIRGYIDSPSNGMTIKGDFDVSGWFLDASGVNKIEVLVDGKVTGIAQYGLPRTDVGKAFPEYQNPNSGYKYTLNTRNLSNGQHTLTIRETGNNGAINTLDSVKFNVQNAAVRGYLDAPTNNSTIKGDTVISGWFLDASGVSKIEILVDGKLIGTAEYGLSRTDVGNAFPEYQNANSGYRYTLNTKAFTNGQHTITVKETGNNGVVTTMQSNVNVQNLPSIGSIDSPLNGTTIKGDVVVDGWFLDASGTSKIEILVDGKIVGLAQLGLSRTDVARVFPAYSNPNSGYKYVLNTRSLTNGKHTISVLETGINGSTTTLNSTVTVQNPASIGSIDSPSVGSEVKGDTVVSGWFLDMSGIAKVEVYVDGKYIGDAQYGLSRPDVRNAFPDFGNSNSGYQLTINSLQFSEGQHALTVKGIGNNGSSKTLTSSFFIGNPYLYVDLRKPSNITASDIVNFFNARRPDSQLKNYAQSFIDAQNRYGVNAQYLVAHAIWETGWGGSNLINYKNNLYGYSAYDPCAFTCGLYFPTVADSIYFVANIVRQDYLTESGKWYNGSNLTGMNVKYATDPNWANGISNLMRSIKPYDSNYYLQTVVHPGSSVAAPSFGRDIPAGQPYPAEVIISYPVGKTATVLTNGLSFRSIPYTLSSTLIKTLSTGKVVTVLGHNTDVLYAPGDLSKYPYDNRWYRVLVDGQQGWVYGGGIVLNN
jgi:beta-N-acetylglucosaminidase